MKSCRSASFSTQQARQPVAATADDAIQSKLSCVRLKYYKDEFLEALFSNKKNVRRSPIINRGYYVRVASFDQLIIDFLQSNICIKGSPKQIISLGGGIDTTFWRLSGLYPQIMNKNLSKFIEIDIFETCARKIMLMRHNEELFFHENILGSKAQIDIKSATILSDKYVLLPGDLTKWNNVIKRLLDDKLMSCDLPTLFISECVLIYVPWKHSETIIKSTAQLFTNGCCFSIYEQILPNDAFGKQMIKNLEERNLKLMSFHKYPTLKAQQNRFLENGWHISVAWDLNRVYREYLHRKETKRIECIEMFDEYEEWHIFMAHYFISSSVRFPDYIKNKQSPTFAHHNDVSDDNEQKTNENDDAKYQQIRDNWCKFGFIHQHYNPKPMVIPTRKAIIPQNK